MLKPLFNFDYWGLPVYPILIFLGAIVSYFLLNVEMTKINSSKKTDFCVLISLVLAAGTGVFCSKVISGMTSPKLWDHSLVEKFLHGGFSYYYGMLAFFGALLLLLRLFKQDYRFWVNETVPYIILFNVIARIGCLLAGCFYGIHINKFSVFGLTVDVFPVRITEIICMIILFIVFKKKINNSRLFWYLLSYSIIRFFLEFLRQNDQKSLLSAAQITSLIVLVMLGLYVFVRRLKYDSDSEPESEYIPGKDEHLHWKVDNTEEPAEAFQQTTEDEFYNAEHSKCSKKFNSKIFIAAAVVIPQIIVACFIGYIFIKLSNSCSDACDSCSCGTASCNGSDITESLFDIHGCSDCLDGCSEDSDLLSDSCDSCNECSDIYSSNSDLFESDAKTAEDK